jgi:hypothetical protein
MSLRLFVLLSCVALLSCGGKLAAEHDSGLVPLDAGAPNQKGLCELATFVTAPQICTMPDVCEIAGSLADGREVRETCTISPVVACELVVNGVRICSCPKERIDWSETCGNGVPTCDGWVVDYTTITTCSKK